MPEQTIFWKHPHLGNGCYTVDTATPKDAAEWAADELPGDLVEDYDDEFDEMRIRNDLSIKVWTGSHSTMPSGEPDYELV